MKKPYGHSAITTVSVTLTIIFYAVFTKYISPFVAGIPGLGFIVGVFASIGFYVSLFQALLWIHFKFVLDIVNPEEAIVGEWFYKLDIRGRENEPRYGICKISRYGGEVLITGIHYHPRQKKFTSRFSSDFTLINGHNLIILYTSVGVDEETFTRKGAFFLSTEETPPKRIYGVWTDVLPNRNVGDIVMQRRDKHTDAILDTVGYPKDSSELQKILNLAPNAASTTQLLQSNTKD